MSMLATALSQFHEGANGPTTTEGDRVHRDGGLFVVPDVLENAGLEREGGKFATA